MGELKKQAEVVNFAKPGERVFTAALFLLGVAAFWQSLLLWFRVSPPALALASAAALPMFMSLLWLALCFMNFFTITGKKLPAAGIWQSFQYMLPYPLPAMIAAIAAYCAALLLQVSFYIATPLFLYACICYLTRRGFFINLLWTSLCIGLIFLVFTMLFRIVLP
ncbi:MAG: hypothetical protein FWG61_07605 [Firmicutes bacterium]|nr:hypothetical protein [Bacillota bacterium]